MIEKYRVHEIARFNYSDIGEYIDENHTDRPLRNDILVELLNNLNDENAELHIQLDFLRNENQHMRDLVNENKQLKSELENCRECLELNRESCARHMKENEQLKQEKRLLKGKLHRLRMEKGAMEEEIECLSEETIEQFKKDLQDGEFIELTARPNVRKHPNDHIGWNGDVE